MATDRLVLLFLHGGGFNKETWEPIIKRVTNSSLLHQVPCEIQTMDWPFHGENAEYSVEPVQWYDGPKKRWPRVDHPAKHWPEWAPRELYKRIQAIQSEGPVQIVVVAHSMGATAAMLVEMTYPGTLAGLVAFEPICNGNMAPEQCIVAVNVMVANTLKREAQWSSWDDVLQHFTSNKLFRKWHPEAMAAYLSGAVHVTEDGGYRLAMTPAQEAAIYCYDIKVVTFKTTAYARIKCPVVFEYGEKTTLFAHQVKEEVAAMYPTVFSVSEPIKDTGHLMILEDPDACAQRVLTNLASFPVFQACGAPSSFTTSRL